MQSSYQSNIELIVICNDKNEEANYIRSPNNNRKIRIKNAGKDCSKTEIVGDSHVRQLGTVLHEIKEENYSYTATSKPGAKTSRVVRDLNIVTTTLEHKDNLVILAGTNDVNLKGEQKMPEEDIINIVSQAKKNKVIIITVPYRFDIPDSTSKIDEYNEEMKRIYLGKATEMNVLES